MMSHEVIITAGIVFIIRIGASGFQWVEQRDQVNLSRMGHVALSNIIMIVQSGSLMYTFLNSKGSSSTWTDVHHILLLLSLAVDTIFRVCMFVWCFINSCCYCTIIAACSWNDQYRPHPHFEQAVPESCTEHNPDTYLQCMVPQVKNLVGHDYAICETAACSKCSQTEELCSIFVMAKEESKHYRFAEHEEYVGPECQIPQLLIKDDETIIIV